MTTLRRKAALFGIMLLGAAGFGCIPKKTAGAGGAGGPAPVADATASKSCGPDGVVDDAEDADNRVAARKGRNGYWYTFADKAGSTVSPALGAPFEMAAQGANGSTHGVHTSGKVGAGDVVYAGIGVNFVDPKGPYDASGYKAVAFWAKRGAGSAAKVRLKVPDASTDPDGKVCSACFNDFGVDLELTETWTRYVIPFATMTQLAGWGAPRPAAIDPHKLYGLQWQANTPGASYDFWIDDVELTGCP